MKPELRRFGNVPEPGGRRSTISAAGGRHRAIRRRAAPFPPLKGNYYPGLRRVITEDADADAYAYVSTLAARPPRSSAAHSTSRASTSSRAASPRDPATARAPAQSSARRISIPPIRTYFALLHYLRVPPGSGTAFYRHRSTGIERVTEPNLATVCHALREQSRLRSSRMIPATSTARTNITSRSAPSKRSPTG